MGRSVTRGLLVVGVVLVCLIPGRARAQQEPWLMSAEAGLLWPPLAPTSTRFGLGGAVGGGILRPFGAALALGLRLRAGLLADGPAPDDPRLVDPGVGDLYSLSFVLRLRPFAPGGPTRAPGVWLELGGGGALTGGLVRPEVEGGIGYLFDLGAVALGPQARWITVFETGNQLESRPAHVLQLGIEIVFNDAAPVPPTVLEPQAGDRDGDGIRDDVDACPDDPEDLDFFEDDDGCPEPDNDDDGVLDEVDQCPLQPEDVDGWDDDDGCPDRDNDFDGFLDRVDDCPLEAEVINGVEDHDGCPDEGLIEMIDDRIVLEERVLFDLNRSRVKHRAWPILQAIVQLFSQHPEWAQVRVEGHADRRGAREFNQRLSLRRAERVRAMLVEFGIPQGIIDAVGHGETQPRVYGTTERAHQLNRRVEFVVLARREVRPEEPMPQSRPGELVALADEVLRDMPPRVADADDADAGDPEPLAPAAGEPPREETDLPELAEALLALDEREDETGRANGSEAEEPAEQEAEASEEAVEPEDAEHASGAPPEPEEDEGEAVQAGDPPPEPTDPVDPVEPEESPRIGERETPPPEEEPS